MLRDATGRVEDLFHDYPHLRELIQRKDALVAARATPPYYLKADLATVPLSVDTFGTKFDVVRRGGVGWLQKCAWTGVGWGLEAHFCMLRNMLPCHALALLLHAARRRVGASRRV